MTPHNTRVSSRLLFFLASIVLAATTNLYLSVAAADTAQAAPKWPKSLWDPLLPSPHHYLHPPLVPFPIVLLFLELGTLILYQARRRAEFDMAAKIFLYLGALSLIPAIFAGLHDVGVDMSPCSAILAGLDNRIKNFTDFTDPLSVHTFYASIVFIGIMLRVVWRKWIYDPAIAVQRITFLGSSAFVAWMVFAAAQVGGSMVSQ